MMTYYKVFILAAGFVVAGVLAACVSEQSGHPKVDRVKTEQVCNVIGGLWGKFDTPDFTCYTPEVHGEEYRKTEQEKRQCHFKPGIWVQLNHGMEPTCIAKSELIRLEQQEQRAQKECTAAGGRWGRGGLLGTTMCFPNYSDAGKSCSRASDCQGMCMSETRTCSASFSFGCLSYLNDEGELEEICID